MSGYFFTYHDKSAMSILTPPRHPERSREPALSEVGWGPPRPTVIPTGAEGPPRRSECPQTTHPQFRPTPLQNCIGPNRKPTTSESRYRRRQQTAEPRALSQPHRSSQDPGLVRKPAQIERRSNKV